MTTLRITPKRNLHSNLWISILLFSLAGCSPEELIIRLPDENPTRWPSLQCEPFIKTGYTDKLSYLPGETMKVFFETSRTEDLCQLSVHTVRGDHAFTTLSSLPLVTQIPADASVNGFDLPVAVEVVVPDLKSGMYLIENVIPFIVRTEEPVDVTVIYPSNTANAYSASGGKSLYSQEGRPPAVSFQRPIPLAALSEVCLKWFAQLPEFHIGYVADIDVDDFNRIANSKLLVIAGHSEYWTRTARENFDRFVDEGGHALILSGNTMWWQVRYSDDRSQLICYRDRGLDPEPSDHLKTIVWTEPILEYPILSSIGAHFPFGGYGTRDDKGWNGYRIVAPASPLFEGLDLNKGDIISLPSLEYDGAPIAHYDEEGFPHLDKDALGFEKIELLGFDKGFRGTETTSTFIVFQKTATSGIIVNTATTDWCSSSGMGGFSANIIKRITYNAMHKLVNDAPVFSD